MKFKLFNGEINWKNVLIVWIFVCVIFTATWGFKSWFALFVFSLMGVVATLITQLFFIFFNKLNFLKKLKKFPRLNLSLLALLIFHSFFLFGISGFLPIPFNLNLDSDEFVHNLMEACAIPTIILIITAFLPKKLRDGALLIFLLIANGYLIFWIYIAVLIEMFGISFFSVEI